jgi:hypothetical protein
MSKPTEPSSAPEPDTLRPFEMVVVEGRIIRINYSRKTGFNYIAIQMKYGESGGSLKLPPESEISEKELIENQAQYLDAKVICVIKQYTTEPFGRDIQKIRRG